MRLKLLAVFVAIMSQPAIAGLCDDGLCQCVDYAKENGWSDFSGLGFAYKWWFAATEKTSSYYVPGYPVGNIPQIGAVLVLKPWSGNTAGHVAIVTKIVDDDEILVNHANWRNDEVIRIGDKVKDASGGKWKKILVQYGADYGSTTYDTNGFIYQKGTQVPTMERVVLYRAGTVGWYPTTDVCLDASEWYRLTLKSDGTYSSKAADASICSEVAPACYAQ